VLLEASSIAAHFTSTHVAVTMDEKYTQPQPRFNQATLLEKMEKIGTKATRSEVISTLFKRGYITSTTAHSNGRGGIGATEIGFEIIQSMRKYLRSILSTDLTRSMEEQLEEIEAGKAISTLVIESATDVLKRTMITFKEKEIEIGRQITEAVMINQNQQQQQQQRVVGTCPICNKGSLRIIRSRITKKRFIGVHSISNRWGSWGEM
jgi:DNA topoisomerase I